MENKLFTPRFYFIITIILGGAMMRLIPHWPNFTPIAAIALFGGTYLNRKPLAFAIPFLAMIISDLIIGFHPWMWAVYTSFAITVGLGIYMSKKVNFKNIILASLLSSVIFFLVTNLAMWVGSPFYSQDFPGLIACYTMGLPFFNNGIWGDLFYNGVFFGGFYFAKSAIPALQRI